MDFISVSGFADSVVFRVYLVYRHVIEYSLKLDSNPEFTSSVLIAYARAAYRMNREGMSGCKTVFDVAPVYLSPKDPAWLRAHAL